MSIIKSAALDEQTSRIADNLPNFSHFVRECLLRHAVNMNAASCDRTRWVSHPRSQTPFETNRCNPTVQPSCFVCWPYGPPPLEAVKKFNLGEADLNYLDHEARKYNTHLIDLKGNSVQSKRKPKSDRKSTFLERFKQLFAQ